MTFVSNLSKNIHQSEHTRVSVLIYNKSSPIYTYLSDSQLTKIGTIVEIPVRNKLEVGVIVGKGDDNIDQSKLRLVSNKKFEDEYYNISGDIIKSTLVFLNFCYEYNFTVTAENYSFGHFFKMMLPSLDLLKYEYEKHYSLVTKSFNINDFSNLEINSTPKRIQIIKLLKEINQISEVDFLKQVSINALKVLIDKNIVKVNYIPNDPSNTEIGMKFNSITLNDDQEKAVNKINQLRNNLDYKAILLDGLPGSGKTEVYFSIINNVINQGKQALVLLPEIGLSIDWLRKFEQRFGVKPYVWNSTISQKNKRSIYIGLLKNTIKVVVATRSGLFLPFQNLGLIVVDEEHDSSFKQEDKVVYNARDMAVARAKANKTTIILATATPSIETWHNVKKGKYSHVLLAKRYNNQQMPEVSIVDMRKNLYDISSTTPKFISPQLLEEVKSAIASKQQILLFINRRGYAPINICKSCGYKVVCPNCSSLSEDKFSFEISLVEHRSKNLLICHYCGFEQSIHKDCISCKAKESIVSLGFGIEKVVSELNNVFNQSDKYKYLKIEAISSDLINSSKKAESLITRMLNKEIDILVGTQLIAKGYNFPDLNLVGILDVGEGISIQGLKSHENTWNLLYQVMGRAGRSHGLGKIIIQTYNPNSLLLSTLQTFDRDKFLNYELTDREKYNTPPFVKIASVILSSINEKVLIKTVDDLKHKIPQNYERFIKGPVPAVMYRVNKKYRYRFLVEAKNSSTRKKIILTWLNNCKIPSSINMKVDIDPISFF